MITRTPWHKQYDEIHDLAIFPYGIDPTLQNYMDMHANGEDFLWEHLGECVDLLWSR